MEHCKSLQHIAILASVVVLLSACAVPTPTSMPTPTTDTVNESVIENKFPTGVFVHETRRIWTLQFNEDGSDIFREADEVDATGTYVINGNQFTEDTDYLPCKHARIATYTWTYDGKGLTFHLVGEDNCVDRRESLDGVTWIKQE